MQQHENNSYENVSWLSIHIYNPPRGGGLIHWYRLFQVAIPIPFSSMPLLSHTVATAQAPHVQGLMLRLLWLGSCRTIYNAEYASKTSEFRRCFPKEINKTKCWTYRCCCEFSKLLLWSTSWKYHYINSVQLISNFCLSLVTCVSLKPKLYS